MTNNPPDPGKLDLQSFLIAYSIEHPGMFAPRFLFALICKNEGFPFWEKKSGDPLVLNAKQNKILDTLMTQSNLITDEPQISRRQAMEKIAGNAFYVPGFLSGGLGAYATRKPGNLGFGLPLIGLGTVLVLMGTHFTNVNEKEKEQIEFLTNSPDARKELLRQAEASDNPIYRDLAARMPALDPLLDNYLRARNTAKIQPSR